MPKNKRVVSNATPLIYLSKVKELDILKVLFKSVLISYDVFKEVCMRKETPDGLIVNNAIKSGWIKVIKNDFQDASELANSAGIQIGEASSIILAKQERSLLIIDDKMGRTMAELMGVSCTGTVGVLLKALQSSIITLEKFETTLADMIRNGFRLDTWVYMKAIKEARNL